jgi:hypothetical protein
MFMHEIFTDLSTKDQYVVSFKRELGNIASSMTVGKELEESVRMLYKKYVRGEKVMNTTAKVGSEGTMRKVNMLM